MIETLRFATDGFRVVYALLATLLWVMTLLFSKQYFHRHRHLTRYFVFYFPSYDKTKLLVCNLLFIYVYNKYVNNKSK